MVHIPTKMNIKKQTKITKLFRKARTAPEPDGCAELEEEIKQLKQTLMNEKSELFELQRNSYRHKEEREKRSSPKTKSGTFIRPEKMILINSVATSKKETELKSMLTGIEIQSYVNKGHCTVVYHMQHNSPYEIKHGVMINMKNDANEVSKTSLPVGFNLPAVLESFTKVMQPECLIAIQKELVAYYDRLKQYDQLKFMLNMRANLFKLLDGSHIEITFNVRNENDPEEEQFEVKLILDYRIYDITPKQYHFADLDMPEGAVDALTHQCAVFKTKPLRRAFREAFINGNGAYVLVDQFVTEDEEHRRQVIKRSDQATKHYNNDETFHPEEFSQSEDDN